MGNSHYLDIKITEPASVPLVLMLCRIAGIRNVVDHMVAWNDSNSKISPGLLVETLTASVTCCGRRALWKIHQFWAGQDLDALFPGMDISLEQLNDDAYGRALDKLADVDMFLLLSEIALNLAVAHKLDIRTVHLDTTSKSVQGVFEGEAHKDFDITYGHSKDRRPDLKQFKLGLGIQEQGQVVMGQMLCGNKSDNKWNPEAVLTMKEFFDRKGFREVVFVSDCALMSSDALNEMSKRKIQFISRLPETFSLARELKLTAWEKDQWEDIGVLSESGSANASSYRVFHTKHELNGKTYDFVVVHSSQLENQKEKTVLKRMAKAKEQLQKQAAKLERESFACEPDALKAMQSFLNEAAKQGFDAQGSVEVKTASSYKKRGRPKNNQEPEVTVSYHAKCEIKDINPDYLKQKLYLESTFVLIASLKPQKQWQARDILAEYKRQWTIEQKFRFLKSPVYLGPVFLQNKKRIHAMGYVFILALMIASYLEYRVRKSLKEQNRVLIWPRGYKNERPSLMTIFEVLSLIKVLIVDGKRRCFPKDIDRQALEVVEWAGFDPVDVYLEPLPMSVIA